MTCPNIKPFSIIAALLAFLDLMLLLPMFYCRVLSAKKCVRSCSGPGFRVQDLRFRVHGLGFWVQNLGFRVSVSGCVRFYRNGTEIREAEVLRIRGEAARVLKSAESGLRQGEISK